jgi:hypothetical protein
MTDTKAPDLAWLNVAGNNQTWLDRPNVNHRAPYIRYSPAREHAEELVAFAEFVETSNMTNPHDYKQAARALLAKIKEQE